MFSCWASPLWSLRRSKCSTLLVQINSLFPGCFLIASYSSPSSSSLLNEMQSAEMFFMKAGQASHGLKNIFINIIIIFVSHKNRQGNHVLGAEHWHFNSSFRASDKLKEPSFMMICFNKMNAFGWGLGLSVVTLLCFFLCFKLYPRCTFISTKQLDIWASVWLGV